MFLLSAFADEIGPDPQLQVEVLRSCDVRHIELRSILGTNVLDLTDLQLDAFKSLLEQNGIRLSAIGSPIGKVKIDLPFEPHLRRFERALEVSRFFDTPRIRIFSFYLPDHGTWPQWREEVIERLGTLTRRAEQAGVTLLHENEHGIYGDDPARVVDLLEAVNSPNLRAVYDAANYVFCGYDPWQGWELTKSFTTHFHIKDWIAGEKHGCLAGTGQGRIPESIATVASTYEGYATLEPHLLGGGPTGGVTGPELFPQAVAAFKAILDRCGAPYR